MQVTFKNAAELANVVLPISVSVTIFTYIINTYGYDNARDI